MFFLYKVVDKDGKEVSGRLEATNRTNAITLLLDRGYTVLSLDREASSVLDLNLFLRVKKKDLVIFSRQIATLFEAEISALRAFNLVAENMQNKYFQGVLLDVAKSIEQGLSVEKALLKHQDVFGEFFISIVAIGEKSGTLPRSFSYLADYTERSADMNARMRKALTYPIFVIVTFFGVILLIMSTVIPQISSILLSSGTELPFVTVLVIGLSKFLQQNVVFILAVTVAAVSGLVFYAHTEEGKRFFDSFVLTMPLFGRLFQEFFLARFSRNLSVMLASGVPIVQSLQILSRSMVNTVYQDMVRQMSVQMKQGVKLSVALEAQEYVSQNIARIVRVGEETGELQRVLETISNLYEKQLQSTIDLLLDLIQPSVIVLLGLGVGVLIGSVIIPIYSISAAI